VRFAVGAQDEDKCGGSVRLGFASLRTGSGAPGSSNPSQLREGGAPPAFSQVPKGEAPGAPGHLTEATHPSLREGWATRPRAQYMALRSAPLGGGCGRLGAHRGDKCGGSIRLGFASLRTGPSAAPRWTRGSGRDDGEGEGNADPLRGWQL